MEAWRLCAVNHRQVLEDEVPKQWVPPYEGRPKKPGSGAASPRSGAAKSGAPTAAAARPKEPSSGSLRGLEQVLRSGSSQTRSVTPPAFNLQALSCAPGTLVMYGMLTVCAAVSLTYSSLQQPAKISCHSQRRVREICFSCSVLCSAVAMPVRCL